MFSIRNDALLTEELAGTYLATSLIACVIGAQFATRDSISTTTRSNIEIVFLSIALFICLWTLVSHFNLISFTIHRIGLILIFLSIMSSLIYLIILSAQQSL